MVLGTQNSSVLVGHFFPIAFIKCHYAVSIDFGAALFLNLFIATFYNLKFNNLFYLNRSVSTLVIN